MSIFVFNAFEMLSAAAQATTPEADMSPEAAAESFPSNLSGLIPAYYPLASWVCYLFLFEIVSIHER